MSLEAESPVHSSGSSDDFAAFLDAELQTTSSDESPNQDDHSFEVARIKRRRVEDLKEGPQESKLLGTMQKVIDTFEEICPPHPGFIREMCIRCGQLKGDGSGVSFGYIHKDLKLGTEEMARLRGADLKILLREQKLYLVLDLDHTLVNSTRLADVSSEEEYLKPEADSMQNDSGRSLFKLDSMHMLTKLRPFLRTFLKEANSMFEMYVYTMADRSYALEIAKLLDPGGVYFSNRVISQADCTQRHQKGLDVVLGAESAVIILDDTEMVWQKHRDNLILMDRYHYFASSCRQFGLNSKSLSESKRDENESDGALATVLQILKRAHEMFFDSVLGTNLASRDVRQVLKTIRQETLKGCKLVFSRVFPIKFPPEHHPLWKLAEQLGAKCCREFDPSVTHVVTTDTGTEKARWALQQKKFLVQPGWIEAANYMWKRQPEEQFSVAHSKPQ